MRACRTELCDADSVHLSRSWLGRCYPLFSLTDYPVCDLHNSSLCSLVCRRWNSPKSHRKTEPLTQYAEMDYTGFPDLLSVYGGAGTHLFISWTAGPLSSLTILILKHHSPYYFPSLATKCLVLIDGSLNSAWDLLEFKGSILVPLCEIPFLCKFQQRRNVLVHALKSRNGWLDIPTCGLIQRCHLFHDVYR